jgi:outer membrane immunogenic protein
MARRNWGSWNLGLLQNRVSLLTGTSLALAFSAAPAPGADLAVRATPVVAEPVVVPFSWTGWYIGANAGYGVGQGYGIHGIVGEFGTVDTFNAMPAGVFGGGQLGYNYQIFNSFVIGAETDIQGSGIVDNHTCLANCTPALFAIINHKLDWFGTTRARVGLATGSVLSYVTAGVAYGEVETSLTSNIGPTSVTTSATKTGWTWGAGLEAALGGNWTAKAEYLYLGLGSAGIASPLLGILSVKTQEQMFRGGINYRFGPAQAPDAPVRNWAGLFAGGTFGAGIGRNDSTLIGLGVSDRFYLSPRGWDAGGIVGYNWQFGNWVAGVEGDFQGSTGTGYLTSVAATFIDQKLSSFSTVRARFGYGVGNALFYATGGAAFGQVKESITAPVVVGAGSFSHSKSGFAAGGGIENKLDFFGLLGPNWTTRTEYLYLGLGSISDTVGTVGAETVTGNIHEHVWRTVVSYKFGGP